MTTFITIAAILPTPKAYAEHVLQRTPLLWMLSTVAAVEIDKFLPADRAPVQRLVQEDVIFKGSYITGRSRDASSIASVIEGSGLGDSYHAQDITVFGHMQRSECHPSNASSHGSSDMSLPQSGRASPCPSWETNVRMFFVPPTPHSENGRDRTL